MPEAFKQQLPGLVSAPLRRLDPKSEAFSSELSSQIRDLQRQISSIFSVLKMIQLSQADQWHYSGSDIDPTSTLDVASVNVASTYSVAGVQVLAAQQPAIADVAGDSLVDAQALLDELKTQVNAILAMSRVHGFLAP